MTALIVCLISLAAAARLEEASSDVKAAVQAGPLKQLSRLVGDIKGLQAPRNLDAKLQDSYYEQLQHYQSQVRSSVKADREAATNDIIEAVVDQKPKFDMDLLNVQGRARTLRTQASDIINGVTSGKESYDGQIDVVEKSIKALQSMDEDSVKQGTRNLGRIIKGLEKRAKTSEKRVIEGDVSEHVTKLIEAKQKGADKKLSKIEEDLIESEDETATDKQELQDSLSEDKEKIQSRMDKFKELTNKINAVSSALPLTRESEEQQLKADMDSEVEDRTMGFEDLLKDSAAKDGELMNQMNSNMNDNVQKKFAQKEVTLQRWGETKVAAAERVTGQFNQMVTSQVSAVQGDGASSVQDAEAKTKALGGTLAELNDDLMQESEREKAFPRQVETTLGKLKASAAEQFNEVRGENIDKMKDTRDSFQELAKDTEETKLEGLTADREKKLADLKAMDSKTIGISKSAALPVNEELGGLRKNVMDEQDKINKKSEEESVITTKVKQLSEQVRRTDTSIADRVEQNDKKVQQEARKVGEAAKKELTDDKAAVAKSFKDTTKLLDGEEKDVERNIYTKTGAFEKTVDKAKEQALREEKSVKKLGERMTENLAEKTTVIQNDLNKLESTTLPAINLDIDKLESESTGQMDSTKQKSDAEVQQASGEVDKMVDAMKAAAKRSNEAISGHTAPLLEKNTKRLSDNEATFETDVMQIEDEKKKMLSDAKDKLELAKEQVHTDDANLENVQESIGDNFQKAKAYASSANTKLLGDLADQKASLVATQAALSGEVMTAIEAVKTRANQDMDSSKNAMEQAVSRAAAETTKFTGSLSGTIEAQEHFVDSHKGDLSRHTEVMKRMMYEAEKHMEDQKKAEEAEAEALRKKTAAMEAATAAAAAAAAKELENQSNKAAASGNAAVAASAAKGATALNSAEKTMGDDEANIVSQVAKADAQVGDQLDAFERNADSQLGVLGGGLSNLEESLAAQKKQVGTSDHDLKAEYEKLEEVQAEQHALFEAEHSAAAQSLAGLVGKDHAEMGALIVKLNGVSSSTKAGVSEQAETDQAFLDEVVKDARVTLGEVTDTIEKTQETADDFQKNVDTVSKSGAETLKKVLALGADFDEKISDSKSDYSLKIITERRDRQKQANAVMESLKKSMGGLQTTMIDVEDVTHQGLGPAMHHAVGTLELEEKAQAGKMKSAVAMEKYQDQEEMDKVESKIAHARELESKITTWKESTAEHNKRFQDLVVHEFGEMGEELDMSELELAKERAAETWAVAQQRQHLEASLGAEIKDMSAVAEARLAALSERSGKEIAALLANEKLTEGERAIAIAKIKEAARKRAQEIMEQDGHLKLDQATAARNIKMASDDVTQSLNRIATLDGTQGPASALTGVMGRIKSLMDDTNDLANQHNSLIQQSGGDMEKQAEEVAGMHAMQGNDANSLLDEALASTKTLEDEDAAMESDLHQS